MPVFVRNTSKHCSLIHSDIAASHRKRDRTSKLLYRLEMKKEEARFENRLCKEEKRFVYLDAEGYESHDEVYKLLPRYIDGPYKAEYIGVVSGSPEALSAGQSRYWLPREAH